MDDAKRNLAIDNSGEEEVHILDGNVVNINAESPDSIVKNFDARIGKESAWISWPLKTNIGDQDKYLGKIKAKFAILTDPERRPTLRLTADLKMDNDNKRKIIIKASNAGQQSFPLAIDVFLWDRNLDKMAMITSSRDRYLEHNQGIVIAKVPIDVNQRYGSLQDSGIQLRFHVKPMQF
jgi:hypothetical protein